MILVLTNQFLTVVFDEPVYGERAPDFTEFMAPGMIILIMYFLAMALTAEVFIIERKDGLIDRHAIHSLPTHTTHQVGKYRDRLIGGSQVA